MGVVMVTHLSNPLVFGGSNIRNLHSDPHGAACNGIRHIIISRERRSLDFYRTRSADGAHFAELGGEKCRSSDSITSFDKR